MMDDIIHVVIVPPDHVEQGLIGSAAVALGKDPYSTRLALAGKVPRVVADYRSAHEAESVVRILREAGVVAIVCTDAELRRPIDMFEAHTLEFGHGEILFRDRAGEGRKMARRDVFLILKGKVPVYSSEKVTKTGIKFSLAATMLAGGIPVLRKTTEETEKSSVDVKYFVRLYGREPADRSVQLFHDGIDYSFLGAKMGSSSVANFNTLVSRIVEECPDAVFDDSLMKSLITAERSEFMQDEHEINCRLVHLCHLARMGLR